MSASEQPECFGICQIEDGVCAACGRVVSPPEARPAPPAQPRENPGHDLPESASRPD